MRVRESEGGIVLYSYEPFHIALRCMQCSRSSHRQSESSSAACPLLLLSCLERERERERKRERGERKRERGEREREKEEREREKEERERGERKREEKSERVYIRFSVPILLSYLAIKNRFYFVDFC